MHIVVYLPNLTKNTGGAEVYGLWVASALSHKHNVTVLTEQAVSHDFDINNVFKKYNIDPIQTDYYRVPNLIITRYTCVMRKMQEHALNKYLSDHQCDLFINVTYGKLVLKGKEKRIHIIHFPAEKGKGMLGSVRDKRYVESYNGFISNSEFTKHHLELMYGVSSDVITPPITVDSISLSALKKKEKIIIAVDRLVRDKCLVEMITSFREIVDKGYVDYRFIIIGNKDSRELDYYNRIVELSNNYPIEIHNDIGYEELVSWYQKALIFWHAKGYGIPDENPFNMEHFGMTTVEAMKNGCIPVVINKAGPKEVVEKVSKDLLWDTLEEMQEITISIINNQDTIDCLQKKVLIEANNYNINDFKSRIVDIVERYL